MNDEWFELLKWDGDEELRFITSTLDGISWPYDIMSYDAVPKFVEIYGGKMVQSISVDNHPIVEHRKISFNHLLPRFQRQLRSDKKLSRGAIFRDIDTPNIEGIKMYIVAPNQLVVFTTKNGNITRASTRQDKSVMQNDKVLLPWLMSIKKHFMHGIHKTAVQMIAQAAVGIEENWNDNKIQAHDYDMQLQEQIKKIRDLPMSVRTKYSVDMYKQHIDTIRVPKELQEVHDREMNKAWSGIKEILENGGEAGEPSKDLKGPEWGFT